MNLTNLAIRRPVLITVVFLIITLLGGVSFLRLPVDLMPDVSFPTLTVQTTYGGVGPEEMEELVSIPLERALSATPGIEEMTSTSSEGNSRIRLSFAWGTDLDSATDEVRARLDRARGQLPDDADTPTVFKFDVSDFPIIFMGVSGDMDPRELREFTDKQLKYRFERIAGVAQANVWGGLSREIHVNLDRSQMHALRINPNQVITALRRENVNEPVGQVVEGDFEVLMRTQGEYVTLDEIRRTMVTRRGGKPVYISDIAEVEDSHQEIRNLVRVDGRPGLRMGIWKQSGANTVDVAKEVQKEIERANQDFAHIHISSIRDSSKFIESAVANVRNAALYGSILAVFVLLLFLRNFRSTLVVAISIPISVIATFGLMYFYGFTLNTVTFGGLALGVGVLVDNAIVVLENIFRHRQEGVERKEAARRGTKEVALAITASTLTTIVVFLPVVFMSGVTGIIFQQLAWVVSFALFSSLLVSLTLVPLLSSRFVRVREPNPKSLLYGVVHAMALGLEALDKTYAQAIRWSLRHPGLIIFATLVVLLSSSLLLPFIGLELEPETDEGEVMINLELAEGTRLQVTEQFALRAEEMVKEQVPEIQNLMTEVGSQGGWRTATTHTISMRVSLIPKSERTRSSQEIARALQPSFARLPGIVTRIRATGGGYMRRMGQGGGDRLSLDIRGYDLDQSFNLAVQLKRMAESIEGVSDARISRSAGRPESQIMIDRDKASTMGLSVSDIATTIRTSVGGTRATYFREGGEEYEILVRYQEKDRLSSEDVWAIPIQTPGGLVVPLQSLVRFERREGPLAIQRKDQQRVVTVLANLSGTRDIGSVVAEYQQKIRSLNVPPDLAIVFSGEWEEQQEAFFFLQLSFLLAVILVYLVMAAQFESFRYPFLIMFSLPLASIGVVLALFLTDTSFNIQAFVGVIMLVGIAVNNAIVLVDYVLQLQRDHGFSLVDSLVTGGRRRLRPILMTTLTTVLGLSPMALGIGEGAELQAPMARVLIGGLISSSLITLFLVPTLFLTMERVRFGRRQEELDPAVEPAMGQTS
ncbi:MAG: efflux RND transporter permease subunit [Acidobacteria bacterium]|nr:efflux RND transporter permease subunit [Acidobacteriota bacterium]